MYKFDVKYTLDNYYEYYKFIMVKQRIIRDLFFSFVFIGIAIYWWVDTSEQTANQFLPIFAIIMGVLAPCMNFISLPMLKKQLAQRQAEIDRTHILITFNDEDIVYENLTVKPEVKEEVQEDNKDNEIDTSVADNAIAKEETKEEAKEEAKEEKVFTLHYQNFLSVNETENLFLFSLDRQTIVIIPKSTFTEGSSLDSFKAFIKSKINVKRVHFRKK